MIRSLWTAASGMRAQQVNVDVIANNLSNVNTTGYKKSTADFKSLLYQNLQSTSTNNAGANKPVSAEVGLGTRTAAITSIYTQGSLLSSQNPFSMAISGDGFFKVRAEDGTTMYTRDGGFNTSPVKGGNMICSSDGLPLLDQNNNPIIIPAAYNSTQIGVNGDDGQLYITKDGAQVPLNNGTYDVKIGLVQFSNPAGLSKEGSNLLGQTVASGAPIPELNNGNVTSSKIRQGFLEGSNVDVGEEMVSLIVAQRAYELSSKAITASDEMMQQANNLRG